MKDEEWIFPSSPLGRILLAFIMKEMLLQGLLKKLALDRPELRGWAMYDWANSAMFTVIVTAVFPVYFSTVANAGELESLATKRLSYATAIGLAFIAVLAPILGAYADYAAVKKKLLGIFLAIGIVGSGGLFFVEEGDWMLGCVMFILANVGAGGSFVFYDSLLPHVASKDEMDRVSTSAYALGYLGGGILLGVCLVLISSMENSALAVRVSFLGVAVWWLVFSIPLFLNIPEPPRSLEPDESAAGNPIVATIVRLFETFKELRMYRNAFIFLIGFLIYNDGIGTIFRMAALYGTEIGLDQGSLIPAILMVQFVGIPFAILFGWIASRIGAKLAITLGLMLYVVISVVGYLAYPPTLATYDGSLATSLDQSTLTSEILTDLDEAQVVLPTDYSFKVEKNRWTVTGASDEKLLVFRRENNHIKMMGTNNYGKELFFVMAFLVAMVQGGCQALSRSLFASMIPRHKSSEFFGFFAVLEKFAGIIGPLVFGLVIEATGSSKPAILAVAAFFIIGGFILRFVDVKAGQKTAQDADDACETA